MYLQLNGTAHFRTCVRATPFGLYKCPIAPHSYRAASYFNTLKTSCTGFAVTSSTSFSVKAINRHVINASWIANINADAYVNCIVCVLQRVTVITVVIIIARMSWWICVVKRLRSFTEKIQRHPTAMDALSANAITSSYCWTNSIYIIYVGRLNLMAPPHGWIFIYLIWARIRELMNLLWGQGERLLV